MIRPIGKQIDAAVVVPRALQGLAGTRNALLHFSGRPRSSALLQRLLLCFSNMLRPPCLLHVLLLKLQVKMSDFATLLDGATVAVDSVSPHSRCSAAASATTF